MSKTFSVALILLPAIFFSIFFPQHYNEPKEPYVIEENMLINQEQGYNYEIDPRYELNADFYPNMLSLSNEDTTIEFYQEDLKTNDEKLSYINYSNEAITKDEVNYKDVNTFKDGNSTILMWSRDKLKRIENDKNYYLKIDTETYNKVYTVIVKSSKKIDDYKYYLNKFQTKNILGTFKTTESVKNASGRVFNDETEKLYQEYFKQSQDINWGIFQPDYLSTENLKTFEKEINHNFKFILWYTAFYKEYNPEQVKGFLEKAYADGKIVELTLQPSLAHDPGNDLFRVLNGEYDEFLDAYAKDVADFDHPVLFRFANEMNGDWCEYSGYRMSLDTELYREMYKYVYSFFEKHNADNVIWVWNPNGKSFPNYKWNYEDLYYPGDKYVDILGLTFYNTGNFYEGENWTEFTDLYNNLYNQSLKKYNMPFMITEFACARAGGNKEQWTKTMLSEINKYKNIKVAVWWNGADYTPEGNISRAYFINDSEEMTEIFKNYFNK